MNQTRIRLLSAILIFSETALGLVALLIFNEAARGETAMSPPAATTSGRMPGTVFRDCPECPEMVVVQSGKFTMGSPAFEKSWAASHGGNLESVADESPQHVVSLRSFALGKYDVTRGEYAAFVREAGYPAGGGCYVSSMPNSAKRAGSSWQNPGFSQTDRDPVLSSIGTTRAPMLLG